jgi:hypothetical protein
MTTTIIPEQMDETLRTLRAEIEEKTGSTPEELYEEREKRVRDATEVRQPDRVPLFMQIPTQRFGSPPKEAIRRGALYFEPDMCSSMNFMSAANVWEILDVKNKVWPGHGLPKESLGHQAIEGEYMKANEYDLFLKDPTGFNIRCYLPRVYGALQPLSRLPSLNMLYNSGVEGVTALFAAPEFEQMAKALSQAGQEM